MQYFAGFNLKLTNHLLEPMASAYKNLSMDELVDLLAQKTQMFTPLMAEKNFTDEYKEAKAAIQEILSEIELRKGSSKSLDIQTGQLNAES